LDLPSDFEGIKKKYDELDNHISALIYEAHTMQKKEDERINIEAGHKKRY